MPIPRSPWFASYSKRFQAAALEGLSRYSKMPLIIEEDLRPFPHAVRKYLLYTGALGRSRVHNFRAIFIGEFRNGKNGSWMPIRSEQYNFTDQPTRLFLMKANANWVPMEALHIYQHGNATMQVKIASLIQVVDAKGTIMDKSETVTLLNDMCLLAPASFIGNSHLVWEPDGPHGALCEFTNKGTVVHARLSFNDAGELTRFVSEDRLFSADGKSSESYPWMTPVRDYKEFDGHRVFSYGEAIWRIPEGDFDYARFHLQQIEYNLDLNTAPLSR